MENKNIEHLNKIIYDKDFNINKLKEELNNYYDKMDKLTKENGITKNLLNQYAKQLEEIMVKHDT